MSQSDKFDETLSRAAARTDSLRAAGLKGLESVALARQVSLEREQGRLSRELGAEHPRVKALLERLEQGGVRLGDLRLDIVRAETVAPKAGALEWVLHGYVWSVDWSPAKTLTVSLVDAQGQWLRALGFAHTDPRGYFQLRAAVSDTAKPESPIPAGQPPREAFIRITDAKRVQVHRSAAAVPIAPGRVDYEEIVLEAEAGHGGVAPEGKAPGPTGTQAGSTKRPRKRT